MLVIYIQHFFLNRHTCINSGSSGWAVPAVNGCSQVEEYPFRLELVQSIP